MAFFVPRKASWHEARGAAGRQYRFEKGQPTEVTDEKDVQKFRNQRDVLMEVTEAAAPAEQGRPSPEEQVIVAPEKTDDTITTKDVTQKGPESEKATKKVRRSSKKE